MAKTRVHDLAKEYGMTSKEMLGHLADMKIPAKSASSTLEDAYVSMVRKQLKPILDARAAEIEAEKRAEAEPKAEEEKPAVKENPVDVFANINTTDDLVKGLARDLGESDDLVGDANSDKE